MVRLYIQNLTIYPDVAYELYLKVEINNVLVCKTLIFEGLIVDVEDNGPSEFISDAISECPSLVNLLQDPEFISKFTDADYIYEVLNTNIKTKGEESSTIQKHNIVINDVPFEETGFVNPFLCIL